MSTTSNEEFLVILKSEGNENFIVHYKDCQPIKSIALPTELYGLEHAVQSSSGSYFVAHTNAQITPTISELASDGHTLIRSWIWESNINHMSIDHDGQLTIADMSRVVTLNPQMNQTRDLMDHDHHKVYFPKRLYYSDETRQLIISHASSDLSATLSVVQSSCLTLLKPGGNNHLRPSFV